MLLVGLCASLAAGLVVHLQDETRQRSAFEAEALGALSAAQRELERSAHVLAGYANHLAALSPDDRITSPYAQAEIVHNPALQGLSWSVLVRGHEREAFEAAQRECQPGFRITERDARGRLVPAGERDTYVVLAAVEPGEGIDPVLGFDIASDPLRADAVRLALLGHAPVAAAGLTRLPEMGGVPGLLLTQAVRDPSDRHEMGVASAVLDVDDLLERCVPPEARGLQLVLDDLGGHAPVRLFPAGKAAEAPDGLTSDMPLKLAGRPWRLRAWLPGAVLADRASHQHWAWVTVGLLTTWLAVRALRSERASRSLLANMLPAHVARQLSEGRRHISDRHAAVSVLFADIVGFSELSARLPAEQLVGLLNDLFTDFDQEVEHHGLEKIKVIGDSYMAVGGLDGRGDAAYRAVRTGQAMLRAAQRMGLQIRVGVHVGPVVAGVLGRTRFTYDLWGETVNVAARMEAHGVPGRVTVSDQARERISARILCDRRGPMVMKGIGLRESWIVREEPAPAP